MPKRDPTRTQILRNEYARKAKKHYREINKAIKENLNTYLRFSADLNFAIEDYRRWLYEYLKSMRVKFLNEDVDYYMKRAYNKGLERAAQECKKVGINISLSWSLLDHEAYNNLFSMSEGLYEKLDAETAEKALFVIRKGVLKGAGIPEIAENLSQATGFNISRAEMIARTEIIRAYNTAALGRYKLYTKKVQWLAAIDERTCERCANLDGKVFSIDDFEPPPIHPRCRCTITPVW